jgi:dTDP-4-dehydrorhamnose reductase
MRAFWMNYEKDILVTGASGLLGRSLMARLGSMGNVAGTGFSNAAGRLFPVDLRDVEALKGLLNEVKPDVVVHSAAYRDPDFCEDEPEEAFRLNVAPVDQFCELLPESVPLLFISSDYVFDGVAAPYREEDQRHPVNEYGRLKMEAEDLVLRRDAGLVLRIPLLIGAGQTWEESGFIFKTLTQIQDQTPSSLDHAGIRFPTWTNDVAQAVAHLLEIEERGIFHYSSLKGGTKYEWALELADLAGLSMEHITPNRRGSASRAVRPRNTQLAVEKIRHTGLSRFTPFREAVQPVLHEHAVAIRRSQ